MDEFLNRPPQEGDLILYFEEVIPDNIYKRLYGICISIKGSEEINILLNNGNVKKLKTNSAIVINTK